MKNKIQFLTMVGCHACEEAKGVFAEVMPEFEDMVEVEEIDLASEKGMELAGKYGIMSSPGIIINDELFSMGGVDKAKLIEKLRSLESAGS